MSTLFMVNPPRKGAKKRKKPRSAKQKAATKKMLAARKKSIGGKRKTRTVAKKRKARSTSQGARMARKKRAAPKRRRRTSVKRRSPVTSLRRHSVYLTNPRKRKRGRRRGTYRSNPGIVSQLKQGAMDAGATLVGGAVARTASGLLPLPKDGIAGVAAGIGVALLVGMGARKVVSADTARFITAGAMQVPIKNLITTFVPQAGAFLGDYDSVGAYALPNAGVGDYLNPGAMYGYQNEVESMGAYD